MDFKKTVRMPSDRPAIIAPGHPPAGTYPTAAPPTHHRNARFAHLFTYTNTLIKHPRTVLLVGMLLIGVAGLSLWLTASHEQQVATTEHVSTSQTTVDTLEYQTILPTGKSIGDLGGWHRVSPAKNDPVYAFNDSIDAVAISVSEQPLPQSFVGNVDTKVAELAKSYSATDSIDAKNTTVYIGTSSKGPQSVIFTKDSLLVLIKSTSKIKDASWASYIESLN